MWSNCVSKIKSMHFRRYYYLSILEIEPITHIIDFLVDLGTVVESLLTSTSDSVLNPARMPGSNASHFAETLVRLARKLLGVPTAGHTFESLSLSYANNVDHLILSKDTLDTDLLLKVAPGKVNLVSDGPTIQLDLNNVGLLLALAQQLLLGVCNQSDNRAVLLDLAQLFGNLLLANVILPLLGGLGESLLFGLGPGLGQDGLETTRPDTWGGRSQSHRPRCLATGD